MNINASDKQKRLLAVRNVVPLEKSFFSTHIYIYINIVQYICIYGHPKK